MEKLDKLEAYYGQDHSYRKGIARLRELALEVQAKETFKWSAPVYMSKGKNVFWIARFKNHFGLGFFNGSLLKDSGKVLENAQPGKTKSMRHWRFFAEEEIDPEMVMDYMKEAMAKANTKTRDKHNT